MKLQDMFGSAVWVGAKNFEIAAVLRGRFSVRTVKRATLRAVGLGFFHCYINGRRVGEDWFLPLSTDYAPRENYPRGEQVSGYRLYVPQYDVTPYLADGENCILLFYGGGYYASEKLEHDIPKYGDPKAIWRIFGEGEDGAFDFGSSSADEIGTSPLFDYYQMTHECHDYTRPSVWTPATPVTPPETCIPPIFSPISSSITLAPSLAAESAA